MTAAVSQQTQPLKEDEIKPQQYFMKKQCLHAAAIVSFWKPFSHSSDWLHHQVEASPSVLFLLCTNLTHNKKSSIMLQQSKESWIFNSCCCFLHAYLDDSNVPVCMDEFSICSADVASLSLNSFCMLMLWFESQYAAVMVNRLHCVVPPSFPVFIANVCNCATKKTRD